MSEYQQDKNKPSKLLTGYTTVRGAELKKIYAVLESQGDVPALSLRKRFARPEASSRALETIHVDRCLKFLEAVDMIQISAQDVVARTNEDVYPRLKFEPRLFHHIRQQVNEQYHLTYLFDVAVSQDVRRLTIDGLFEAVKEDDGRSFGLTWRREKLRMWANLTNHVGGISYTDEDDENEVIVSPSRRLLADLLGWYSKHGDDPDRFARAMEWIDQEFFPVFADRLGTPTVAVGVADVLNNMENEKVLTLRAMTDTQDVAEVPRSSRGGRSVATFSIDAPPERPSYWYPLERSERRISA